MPNSKNSGNELLKEIDRLRYRIADLEQVQAAHERFEERLLEQEKESRRFGNLLATLVQVTNELSNADSLDDLCRKAVAFGRSRLGFDRVGIWFRTDEPDTIVGSFGVDENSRIIDERGLKRKIDPDTPDGRVLLAKQALSTTGESFTVGDS